MRTKHQNFVILCFMLVFTATVGAGAKTSGAAKHCTGAPDTDQQEHHYFVVDQRLDHFIEMLALDSTQRISSSVNLPQAILNLQLCGTTPVILDSLSSLFDLDWFSFNSVHFVSERSEAVTRLIRLGVLDADVVMASLEESGIDIQRYPIHLANNDTAIVVTGPPQYVAILEGFVENMKPKALVVHQKEPKVMVRVRRGTDVSEEAVK